MIKEIEVDGVKHGVTLADYMIGDGITQDAESGQIKIVTCTQIITEYTPFVPLSVGGEKKLGVILHNGLKCESGTLALRVGTVSGNDDFVPIAIGSCDGRDGYRDYFGLALGNGLGRNKYNQLVLSNPAGAINVGTSLVNSPALDVRLSTTGLLEITDDGLAVRIGSELDKEKGGNVLVVKLSTQKSNRTRVGYGLCVDRIYGLQLNLAGNSPLKVNNDGELFIDIQHLKTLLAYA